MQIYCAENQYNKIIYSNLLKINLAVSKCSVSLHHQINEIMTNEITTTENQVTLNDLQNVLNKMDFYNRKDGFIANDMFGNLTFFDVEPSFGGAYVTREDILEFINNY
jgi:hypothetical protein